MAQNQLHQNEQNIYQYPNIVPTEADQLSIGDLHANAMLFMNFLVTHGIAKISEEQYKRLGDIYLKETLEKEDIAEFNKIIDSLELDNKTLIRLIGDEIADRGQNDYFIFKILQKLKNSGVKTEILLSNHGIEFLESYERHETLAARNINFQGQAQSLNKMRDLIERDIISREEVDALVEEVYKPQLKLISYAMEGNNLTIMSHAGIGLETIKSLAEKFKDWGVVYKDDTIDELAGTIDAINAVFSAHVKAGIVHQLPVQLATQFPDYKKDPITFLLWNRDYSNLERPETHKGYNLFFVHGHDSQEATNKNIFNLDGMLGKYAHVAKGILKILGTNGGPCPNLDAQQKVVTPENFGSKSVAQVVATAPAGNPCPNLDAQQKIVTPENLDSKSMDQVVATAPADNPSKLDELLTQLKNKAEKLATDGHITASEDAMKIHSGIVAAREKFNKDGNKQEFKKTCDDVVAANRGSLDTHRGWSEFLVNLLLVVAAVIPFVLKGVVNVCTNRNFLFVHQTKTGKLVDEVVAAADNESSGTSNSYP